MEQKKYSIGGKTFIFNLSLRADELAAPIKKAMLEAVPDAISSSAAKLARIKMEDKAAATQEIADERNTRNLKDITTVVIDQAIINNWFF